MTTQRQQSPLPSSPRRSSPRQNSPRQSSPRLVSVEANNGENSCERSLVRNGLTLCLLFLLLSVGLPSALRSIRSTFLHSGECSVFVDVDPKDEWNNQQHDSGHSPSPCKGKEPLLKILEMAEDRPTSNVSVYCSELPNWSTVVKLYGSTPVIVGHQHCPTAVTPTNKHRVNESVKVAGNFNSGTNLLARHLHDNFLDPMASLNSSPNAFKDYNAPWGKHSPMNWTKGVVRGFFPIVIVKDAYSWMLSMCRLNYGAHWEQKVGGCPNLVKSLGNNTVETFPILVTREQSNGEPMGSYASLADFWSRWNNLYLFSEHPHLIIRYEDLLFHAPVVLKTIANCTGLKLKSNAQYYRWGRTKESHKSSGLLSSLRKYGGPSALERVGNMSAVDLIYAREHLDRNLMELFHYSHPEGI